MNCKKCGKKLRDGQTVCPRCGTSLNGQVSMRALSGAKSKKKKADEKKKMIIWIAIIAAAVLLALIVAAVTIVTSLLGNVQRGSELSGSMGVVEDLPTGVQNIALFGLDTRKNDSKGRSDAMIVLSIDRDHNKIKLTSLARDSLVPIDGHGKSKLTNAFIYGGPNLAVKTINKNFGLNITDYAYVNFYEFAEIIDYIGGVNIDVSASEKEVMNRKYVPYIASYGIPCEKVTKTGMQRLSGGQALAYARNRYTGNDTDRCDRQKEVLLAMYDEVKTLSVTKFPTLISKVLGQCHTNMTKSEMLSVATWTLSKKPTFEQLNIPGDTCHAQGGNWYDGHGWVWRYDTGLASAVIYNFIYEAGLDLDEFTYTTVKKYTGTTAKNADDDPEPTTKAKTVTTTSPTKVTEPTGYSDPEEPDSSDISDDPGESTEPDESDEPSESTEPTEPSESTEPTEQSEPADDE